MKLGQNGEKNLVHKSILKINFKPFKKLERVGGASNIKNREHVIVLIEPLTKNYPVLYNRDSIVIGDIALMLISYHIT